MYVNECMYVYDMCPSAHAVEKVSFRSPRTRVIDSCESPSIGTRNQT